LSSSSKRAEGFDPYAFAVRWYEEHPEVLREYEEALRRKLKSGLRLDELEEIEEKAFEFGRLVREAQDLGNEKGRFVRAHHEWVRFRENLPRGIKTEAVDAYRRGYLR
jgi:hypothetical protein